MLKISKSSQTLKVETFWVTRGTSFPLEILFQNLKEATSIFVQQQGDDLDSFLTSKHEFLYITILSKNQRNNRN